MGQTKGLFVASDRSSNVNAMTGITDPQLPKLEADKNLVTSPPTIDYNCIAWAAGEDDRWWWPDSPSMGFGYWPPDIPREETVDAFIKAFEALGYSVCPDDSLELDHEKVVLYVDANRTPTHMARQLADGKWTSKLGRSYDISHDTANCVSGGLYGRTEIFMRRPRT